MKDKSGAADSGKDDSQMAGASKLLDIKKLLGTKKGSWILTLTGLAGILLIFLSNNLPKGSSRSTQSYPSMEDYSAWLEKRLRAVVEDIAGGDVRVMVTLESGYEMVYANQTAENTDKAEETTASGAKKIQEKDSREEKYILVEDADGHQIALRLTELSPRVKGVVVVCPAPPDEYLRHEITSVLMAVLDIPSRRIYVTG